MLAQVRGLNRLKEYTVYLASRFLEPNEQYPDAVIEVGCLKVPLTEKKQKELGRDFFFEGVKANTLAMALTFLYPIIKALVKMGAYSGYTPSEIYSKIISEAKKYTEQSLREEKVSLVMR